MGTQILSALQILHNGGYVHCDLKPDNICVKETIDPQSKVKKYIFSLIDFGLMRKVKLNKILKDKVNSSGNIAFSSIRGLKKEQVRFQDDIESLLYIMFWCAGDQSLPWEAPALEFYQQQRLK